MARRNRFKPAVILRKVFFFVAGSLVIGVCIIVYERLLSWYLPKHFSVSLGVGLAVATGLWLLKLVKHPPFMMKKVSPLVAGFCAGLGVHLARVWLR